MSAEERIKRATRIMADACTEALASHVTAHVQVDGRRFVIEISNHEETWADDSGGFKSEHREVDI